MKVVNFKRRAAAHFAWIAVVAATSISQKAVAEIANPGLVPAESAYIISVPDAPAFWNAWKANSLYSTWQQFQELPDVKKNADKITKELNVIEASLGYKVDGETFSQIFKNAVIFVQSDSDNKPVGGMAFVVSDKEKLHKMLDLVKKAAVENASSADAKDDADDKDDDKDDKKDEKSAVSEKDIILTGDHNGVAYTGIKSKKDSDSDKTVYYAEVDDKLLVSFGKDNLTKLIDRAKTETPGADTAAGHEEIKKLVASFADKKGEIYIYGNQEASYKMQEDTDGTKIVKKLTRKFSSQNWFGANVVIKPKEISSHARGLLDPNDKDSLIAANPGGAELGILNLVPAETILTFGTSLMDAGLLYNTVKEVADAEKEGNDFEENLKKMEADLGFSIKDDLVPALGKEIGFSLNKVDMSQGQPEVHSVLAVKVGDKAKMDKVVGALENLAKEALEKQGGEVKIQEEKVGDDTLKYVEIPNIVKLSPGILNGKDYVLIGSSTTGIKNAAAAKADGNVATNEVVKSLAPRINTKGNMFQYWDLEATHKLVNMGINMTPMATNAKPYLELMKVLKAGAGTSYVEDNTVISESVLLLN